MAFRNLLRVVCLTLVKNIEVHQNLYKQSVSPTFKIEETNPIEKKIRS
jgi:hypothetical protein